MDGALRGGITGHLFEFSLQKVFVEIYLFL